MDTRFVSAALLLFFVLDPLGNIPAFTTILGRIPVARRRPVLIRELLIALAFLIGFLVGGRSILNLLGLQQEAIRVGGGVVLFLIALRLIFPSKGGLIGDTLEGEPLVFPLAVPLIAGPSAFATVLLLVESAPGGRWEVLGAVVAAWAATAVILASSSWLLRALGERGLLAVERLMGMLLVMVATQMMLEGVAAFLKS